MKDFLGKDIEINDYVIFIKGTATGTSTSRKQLYAGKVIGFTNKKVKIKTDYIGAEWGHKDYGFDTVFPKDIVIVDKGAK